MRTQSAHRKSLPKPNAFLPSGTWTHLSIAILWVLICVGTSHPTFADQPSPMPTQAAVPDTQADLSRMDDVIRYYVHHDRL